MTCFLVDDQLMLNGKIQAAVDLYGGPGILALWLAVATACGGANTEGVIAPAAPKSAARMLIMHPPELDEAVRILVETRLWHDERTVRKCAACVEHLVANGIAKLPKGAYLFHDWGQQQFNRKEAKDPVARSSKNRKNQLHRMPNLKRAIVARDGEYCRYCAVKVDFMARTGRKAGTYDHLRPDCFEPDGGNFLDGVVVACAGCNSDKGHRTPEEWLRDGGIALLPAPDRGAGTGQDPANPGAGADPALADARARLVPGQDGSRPGAGPAGQDEGSGRALALASNGHHTNGKGEH